SPTRRRSAHRCRRRWTWNSEKAALRIPKEFPARSGCTRATPVATAGPVVQGGELMMPRESEAPSKHQSENFSSELQRLLDRPLAPPPPLPGSVGRGRGGSSVGRTVPSHPTTADQALASRTARVTRLAISGILNWL